MEKVKEINRKSPKFCYTPNRKFSINSMKHLEFFGIKQTFNAILIRVGSLVYPWD